MNEMADVSGGATERDLEVRAVAGDRDAMGDLYRLHATRMTRWIARQIQDRSLVEDILHDAWLKIARSIRTCYDPMRPFYSWAIRVARNVMLDTLKILGRRPEVPAGGDLLTLEAAVLTPDALALWERKDQTPEQVVERRETARELALALAMLPRARAEVIAMKYFDGMTAVEIAHAIGTTPANVRKRLERGIRDLREAFLLVSGGSTITDRAGSAGGRRPFVAAPA
jgi:RNA polymerase sigma factor (sigma-70 family)